MIGSGLTPLISPDGDITNNKKTTSKAPNRLIIPEDVITTIALHSTKPHFLITALVLLLYKKTSNPYYYGGDGTPKSAICHIEQKFKKDQLKRAYNRLVELGILKKKGKEFIIPWIEEVNHE